MTTIARVIALLFASQLMAACANHDAPPPPVTVTSASSPVAAKDITRSADFVANGVRIHYLIAGKGPPVVLLHGYGETSRMWRPLIASIANRHTVIAPDLRGSGESDRPMTGYDKKTLANDIHALVRSLNQPRVKVVGHDIGLMVAYAYAAQHPAEIESITLMDGFLPGIGAWESAPLIRDRWQVHFYGETPLKLVEGRERTYLEHFWNDYAADKALSLPEVDRQVYAASYADSGGMRAGFEYFRSLSQDALDFEGFSATKLAMPMLVMTGEKAAGTFMIEQACAVATNVEAALVRDTGHWLMEEAPASVIPRLGAFLDGEAHPTPTVCTAYPRAADLRLSPHEIDAVGATTDATGVLTSTLKGDPTRRGLYTIVLRVPPNTRIEPHAHPDDRVATVVSGQYKIGFGDRYDESKMKELSPGSFYVEPPGQMHFARTGKTPVVLQISGVGPTATTSPK